MVMVTATWRAAAKKHHPLTCARTPLTPPSSTPINSGGRDTAGGWGGRVTRPRVGVRKCQKIFPITQPRAASESLARPLRAWATMHAGNNAQHLRELTPFGMVMCGTGGRWTEGFRRFTPRVVDWL